jgi:murein DD-endopeptidase MepM/ murein hydrolase activator NlpD
LTVARERDGRSLPMLRAGSLAGLILTCASCIASAQDMKVPQVVEATIDWPAVKAELAASVAFRSIPAAADLSYDDGGIARLNAVASRQFPDTAKSSVPVLVPIDIDALLRGNTANASTDPAANAFTSSFRSHLFAPGPSGYDAVFALRPADLPDLGSRITDDVYVTISGSSVLYELDAPTPSTGTLIKDLQEQFPGIRRQWLESNLRYTFVRYGVPYAVSILCFEGSARGRQLSCRDADKVLTRFLKALHVAGGTPQSWNVAAQTIDRPAQQSATFTYNPPGRLIQNTGFRGQDGRADYTVYAQIRFPLAQAPAYANSQSFLNWGDCDHTGRTLASQTKAAPYRCRVNDKPLIFDESAAENRAYPWRDNFCEHRWFFVGQCPGGMGHQGQDIRPATCQLRNEGADRCNPFQDDVVAVRDGVIFRPAQREAAYLIVNAPGEHVRFRYLHMDPKKLDADGVLSGRRVREGEVFGKVGNYDKRDNGTTYHLHFDVQVPTKDGWVFVSPYMTLVSAYERLLGERGQEIKEPVAPPALPSDGETVAGASPSQLAQTVQTAAAGEANSATHAMIASNEKLGRIAKDAALAISVEDRQHVTERACPQKLSARRGHRTCGVDVSHRKRTKHARVVRSVGHHVSGPRHRPRSVGSDVQPRDDGAQAGHFGLRAAN